MSTSFSSGQVPGPLDIVAELSQQKLRTTAIEFAVAQLREKIDQLGVGGGDNSTSELATPETLEQIAQITREIFDRDSQFTVARDPAEPSLSFLECTVAWIGEQAELLSKRRAWHERVRQAFPDQLNHPRLCIVAS